MKKLLTRLREFIKLKIFRPLLLQLGNFIGQFSIVGDKAIFDKSDFNWTEQLEKNWLIIRRELEHILTYQNNLPSLQDIQREQYILNQDNQWRTFFLYGFGIKATLNCELCPQTTALLESIPCMTTAFFSVLSPRKHIPAHRGIYKGLIRCHLGLIIPGNPHDCSMRIENNFIYWKEGEAIVFDDTREHEVWNNTDQTRVVLLLDVIRPYRSPFRLINHFLIRLIGNSSYVKEATANHLKWEADFHSKRIMD